jgi:riboflavin biosynthesis pyrimidine reductase
MISPAYGLALEAQISSIEELAECYGAWEGIRTNHVVDGSGNFWGADFSSRSISTADDKQLLMALRAKADLVVVDAKTAREERYRLPSSGAALAIFSASGNFAEIPALEQDGAPCFLFSPQAPANLGNHHHEPITSLENPLEQLSTWAHENAMPAVLFEAGPTLSLSAFRNGLVANSALTISADELDAGTVAGRHPFDSGAKLLSVANGKGASFTYWSH